MNFQKSSGNARKLQNTGAFLTMDRNFVPIYNLAKHIAKTQRIQQKTANNILSRNNSREQGLILHDVVINPDIIKGVSSGWMLERYSLP